MSLAISVNKIISVLNRGPGAIAPNERIFELVLHGTR